MFSRDKSNSKSVVLLKFHPFNFYQLGWQRKRRVQILMGEGWQRERRVAKGKKGGKGKEGHQILMREGWQREKRVPNFNESRVAKSKVACFGAQVGELPKKTVLVESEETISD